MDQLNLGESSGSQSVDQAKRRRGRPRKDQSLMYTGAAPIPPGFDRVRESQPHIADRVGGADNVIGQAVTGVVEGSFDSGYLLTVRIGNFSTNFRGVVFKPGHYVPITAVNDIAPHLQMIRRNDVGFPAGNRGWPHNQDPAIPPALTVPPKRKRRRKPPSISASVLPSGAPPVGMRGTVVPVVLQPVKLPNGPEQRPPNASQHHLMLSGEKDVQSVEPLAMLLPDQSISASQIFVATQSHMAPQTSHGSEKVDNTASNEGTASIGKGANVKPMESTGACNSSGMSDTRTSTGQEGLNSSMENFGGVSKQETWNVIEPPSLTGFLQARSEPKALFNYEKGRMTELLQENLNENQAAEIAGQPPKAT